MFLGHSVADGLVHAATVIYSKEDLFVYAYTVIQPTSFFFITNFVFQFKLGHSHFYILAFLLKIDSSMHRIQLKILQGN